MADDTLGRATDLLNAAMGSGDPDVLDRAIGAHRQLLTGGLSPTDEITVSANLAAGLAMRSESSGPEEGEGALTEAIGLAQRALALLETEELHAETKHRLSADLSLNLGRMLEQRFALSRSPADRTEAIDRLTRSTGRDTITPGRRVQGLRLLRALLAGRYEEEHDLRDLDKLITVTRLERILLPADDEDRLALSDQLAFMYLWRFEQKSLPLDLDRALDQLPRADVPTPGDEVSCDVLLTVAQASLRRFDVHGGLDDIRRAVKASRWVLLTPTTQDQHVQACRLVAFAMSRQHDLADPECMGGPGCDHTVGVALLEEVLEAGRDASNLTGVGVECWKRYRHSRERSDIDDAVTYCRQAVEAAEESDPNRDSYLHNLGLALRDRSVLSDEPRDLDDGISAFAAAVAASTPGQVEHGYHLLDLANGYRLRCAVPGGGSAEDRDLLRQTYRAACAAGLRAGIGTTLKAASAWSGWEAEQGAWDLCLEAARAGIKASEILLRRQHDREDQATWLIPAQGLSALAAFALAKLDRLDEAVEAIEAGRLQLLRERMQESLEDTPGGALLDVPLVYLLSTPVGGLALAVVSSQGGARETAALWMPHLSEGEFFGHVEAYLGAYNARRSDPEGWEEALASTTAWLWSAAMGALVDELESAPGFCLVASGYLALLPLHAAWAYDETRPSGRRYVMDSHWVRYVPSNELIRPARSQGDGVGSVLVVVDPQPSDAEPLQWAHVEAAHVTSDQGADLVIPSESADLAHVRPALSRFDILHFACHGRADTEHPLDGYLLLARGERLTIRELQQESLSSQRSPGPRLVVLSACETAVIGTWLTDEVMGFQTALLVAGAAGVVGSLWAVPDESTAVLMSEFYAVWRSTGCEPWEALAVAQRSVRDMTNRELLEHYPEIARNRINGIPKGMRAFWLAARPFLHPSSWAAFSFTGS